MKMTTLPYWGQIIGLVSQSVGQADKKTAIKAEIKSTTNSACRSLFITKQQPLNNDSAGDNNVAQLYILDNRLDSVTAKGVGQFELSTLALPCEMTAIMVFKNAQKNKTAKNNSVEKIILLGKDGHLYETNWQAKSITKISVISILDALIHQDALLGFDSSQSDKKSILQQLTYHASSRDSTEAEGQTQPVRQLVYPIGIDTLEDALVILYASHIVIWSYKNGKVGNDVANDILVQPYLPSSDDTVISKDNPTSTNSVTVATSLATSSDGHWLVIGDKLGNISSYQWLTQDTVLDQQNDSSKSKLESEPENETETNANCGVLAVSSQKKIHEGQVNALCFELVGHYFFSAGADKKLFRAHVQGELHPLDRAKSSGHNEKITALCVSDTRLFSAADDKTIKSWALDKGQPNTCSDQLTKTRLLTLTRYNEQVALLAVGTDQSLRFVPLAPSTSNNTLTHSSKTNDDSVIQADKLQEVSYIIKDGYQRVKDLLSIHPDQSSDASNTEFDEGLALLNDHPDAKNLDIVNTLLNGNNKDNESLKVSQTLQLVEWIASTDLPKTIQVLEKLLNSNKGARVRLAAFEALAKKSATTSHPLQYLETAIKSKHEEIVASAIHGYLQSAFDINPFIHSATNAPKKQPVKKSVEQLASERRRLLPILQEALTHKLPNIQKQALASLEVLLPDDSPKAELIALNFGSSDIIQAALIRLYQRDMLDGSVESLEVSRQLTQLQNHQDSSVRQTAFYISILSKPELVQTLKEAAAEQGDAQLTRTLEDFNNYHLLRGTLLDSLPFDNVPSSNGNPTQKDTSKTGLSNNELSDKPLNAPHSLDYILNLSILQANEKLANETLVKEQQSNSNASGQSGRNSNDVSSEVNLELSTQDFVSQSTQLEGLTEGLTAKTRNDKANNNANNNANKKEDIKEDNTPNKRSSNLDNHTLEPLLQALANPYADIVFRAAYSLACLQDSRAFGALIRLIHTEDTSIRAGVAKALGSLQLNDAKSILPALLDDQNSGVRQVAMQAYGKLVDNTFEWASAGFGSAHQDVHEQALAIFLTQTPHSVKPKATKRAGKKNQDLVITDTSDSSGASQSDNSQIGAVLQKALNNPFSSIRQEVVKVLLNRVFSQTSKTESNATSIIDVIKLLQQSLFEDVHQIALEEWQRELLKANSKTKPPSKDQSNTTAVLNAHYHVLGLFFADNFTSIRDEAFKIALKQHKQLGFSEVILAALSSPYIELRKHALDTLVNKASVADLQTVMPALVAIFDDESFEMRSKALNTALTLSKQTVSQQTVSQQTVVAQNQYSTDLNDTKSRNNDTLKNKSQDNELYDKLIQAALESVHPDIQLTVARLLATQSKDVDTDNKAYSVLKHYLEQPIPNQDENSTKYKNWYDYVTQALQGLAELRHPDDFDAIDWYVKYLNHPDANFDRLAVNLMWVVANKTALSLDKNLLEEGQESNVTKLIKLQKDENTLISQSASLALAVWGDEQGQHFFNKLTEGSGNSNTQNSNAQNSNSSHDISDSQTNWINKLPKPMSPIHWLQARHGLGINNANQIAPLFDMEVYAIGARLLLVFQDLLPTLSSPTPFSYEVDPIHHKPARMMESLSFVDNQTAVFYANILARYNTLQSANTSNTNNEVWQYISTYLSQKLNNILSAFNLDNKLKSNLNLTIEIPSIEKDSSLTSSNENSSIKMMSDSSDSKVKPSNNQTSVRKAILTALSPSVLQHIARLCFDPRPLVKAKAIEVICLLSYLLQFQPYSHEDTVYNTLIIWHRTLQSLLSDIDETTFKDTTKTEKTKNASVTTGSNRQYPYQDLAFGILLGMIRDDREIYARGTVEQAIRGLMWLASPSPFTLFLSSTTSSSTDSTSPISQQTINDGTTEPNQSNLQDINNWNEDVNNWKDSISRVLLPLLNHDGFDIRELVWQSLIQLNIPAVTLAEHAMSSPHENMVKRGLQLLLASEDYNVKNQDTTTSKKVAVKASEKASEETLTQHLINLLHTNSYTLVEAVYEVLKQRVGMLQASLATLDIPLLLSRQQRAIEWQEVNPETTMPDLYNDKLTYLLQAIHNEDRDTQLIAFEQLIDYPSELIENDTLINALFEFWAGSTTGAHQTQVFNLIVNTLLSINEWVHSTNHQINSDLANDKNYKKSKPSLDNLQTAIKLIKVNSLRLLGLIDHSQLAMKTQDIYQQINRLRQLNAPDGLGSLILFDPLLQRLQTTFNHSGNPSKTQRQQLFDTLIVFTGFDQPIEDYPSYPNEVEGDIEFEDQQADWLKKQYPRYPNLLIELFNTLIEYGDYDHASQLLRSIAWAKDNGDVNSANVSSNIIKSVMNFDVSDVSDVSDGAKLETLNSDLNAQIDRSLILAYQQMPSKYARELVETMAYRANIRHGGITGLELALQSRDSEVQYIASEGLAKYGNFEGLSILMATIDYHTDGDIRRRSVLALGELLGGASHSSNRSTKSDNKADTNKADTKIDAKAQTHAIYQAYDKLIGLAEDNDHFLQDVASEALGRLSRKGNYEHSQHVFELLKDQLNNPNVENYNPAIKHWLNGLRWLDTPEAWEVIRHYIHNIMAKRYYLYEPQIFAISLLQYSDSKANKALLLDILKKPDRHEDIISGYYDEEALTTAYKTAQKLWGNDPTTVYPYDWALLRCYDNTVAIKTNYLSRKRVSQYSSIEALSDFINQYGANLPADNLSALENAILSHEDMPMAQLLQLLTGEISHHQSDGKNSSQNSNNDLIRDIAIRYLIQHPNDFLNDEVFNLLQQCFDSLSQQWQSLIETASAQKSRLSDQHFLSRLAKTATTLEHLIWLQVRYLPLQTDAKTKTATRANEEKIVSLVEWLMSIAKAPVIMISPTLAVHINNYWQQLLLALLARSDFSNDAYDNTALLNVLKSASQFDAFKALSYANQDLLQQAVSHIESAENSEPQQGQGTDSTDSIAIDSSVSSQQILDWLKTEKISALVNVANDNNIETVNRIRAIEALGQIHEPQAGEQLESLMSNDLIDEELRKLTYKVLRRWQRMMVRVQQKRPAPFSTPHYTSPHPVMSTITDSDSERLVQETHNND